MKQLIARLRELDVKFRSGDGLYGTEGQEYQNALPQLLDRLEKLEAVVELTYALKHIVDHLPQQDEYFEDFLRQTSDKLEDALAALDAKGSG